MCDVWYVMCAVTPASTKLQHNGPTRKMLQTFPGLGRLGRLGLPKSDSGHLKWNRSRIVLRLAATIHYLCIATIKYLIYGVSSPKEPHPPTKTMHAKWACVFLFILWNIPYLLALVSLDDPATMVPILLAWNWYKNYYIYGCLYLIQDMDMAGFCCSSCCCYCIWMWICCLVLCEKGPARIHRFIK